MTSFPSYSFSREFIKVRFLEEQSATAINRRWYGMPRGVYIGFSPQTTPSSNVLTLAVDSNHGFSLLKVGSQTQRVQVDIFTDQDLDLDFSDHTTFPVYVIGRADYKLGSATRGTILTRATTASGPREVLICKVNKVDDDLVVTSDAPELRQPPIAFEGQQVGFMSEGAVGDIVLGNSATAEVTAARTSSLTGGPYPSLKDRIDGDLTGSSMADRLGLRLSFLVSNEKRLVSGSSTNVSGSFAGVNREFQPKITVEAGGDESSEGAITSPTDTSRNLCFVVNSETGARLVNESDQEPVFGKLSYSSGNVSGTIDFFNGTTTVTGSGGPFGSIQEGDIVRAQTASHDEWYEIATIVDANNAILGSAYQGGTAGGSPDSIVNPPYRRFTLSFETVASGSISISTPTSIRFIFPAFYRPDRSIYDGWLLINKDGELPVVPSATQTVPGKAFLATTDGKVGSVRTVENSGTPVGNDFHTFNFVYGGATDSGLGLASVSVTGPTGPAGADSDVGPTGPQGIPGEGYAACNPFEVSSTFQASITHTVDFSAASPAITNIKHVFGGIAGIKHMISNARVKIDYISRVSNTTGEIKATMTNGAGTAGVKVWIGACQ